MCEQHSVRADSPESVLCFGLYRVILVDDAMLDVSANVRRMPEYPYVAAESPYFVRLIAFVPSRCSRTPPETA